MKEESEANIGYELRELFPLVALLAEKYTGFESSSITYECAQQLMEAVIYCIREYQNTVIIEGEEAVLENKDDIAEGGEENRKMQVSAKEAGRKQEISAAKAYQRGYEAVVQKAKDANILYNEIMENFCDYGSRVLYETMVAEMPEFFLHYDVRFAPQENPMFDYPLSQSAKNLSGIDLIYQYLCCIHREQEFLRNFPEADVRKVCMVYYKKYGEFSASLTEIFESSML